MGLLFLGPPGCGKTKRMRMISKNCDIETREARNMVLALIGKQGSLAQIRRYANLPEERIGYNVKRLKAYDLIIDDLGEEPQIISLYGTKVDAMGMMLKERFDNFPKVRTYITTNLDYGMLLARYGERIVSRMFEQLLLLRFKNIDHRKLNADTWKTAMDDSPQ
jgi:DNA replication protein DnaC